MEINRITEISSRPCSSGEELVTYLYDEMDAQASSNFESHLADCESCTGEFARISFARLDAYEWNRDEFASLATPRIVIPYVNAKPSVSWLDSLRGFWGSSGRLAGAGAAFAALVVALGAWFTFQEPVELAGSTENRPSMSAQGSPVADAPQSENFMDTGAGSDLFTEPANDKSEFRPVKASSAGDQRHVAPRTQKPRRVVEPDIPVRNLDPPRLNDFVDENDTTLRLGDLLAEVDTRF